MKQRVEQLEAEVDDLRARLQELEAKVNGAPRAPRPAPAAPQVMRKRDGVHQIMDNVLAAGANKQVSRQIVTNILSFIGLSRVGDEYLLLVNFFSGARSSLDERTLALLTLEARINNKKPVYVAATAAPGAQPSSAAYKNFDDINMFVLRMDSSYVDVRKDDVRNMEQRRRLYDALTI